MGIDEVLPTKPIGICKCPASVSTQGIYTKDLTGKDEMSAEESWGRGQMPWYLSCSETVENVNHS
jgi:hypothetical protein